jgi:hypothetical protein
MAHGARLTALAMAVSACSKASVDPRRTATGIEAPAGTDAGTADGATADGEPPARAMTDRWVRGAERAVGIASTPHNGYALLGDGRLLRWDDRTDRGPALEPAPVARALRTSEADVCLITTAGEVACRTDGWLFATQDAGVRIEEPRFKVIPGVSDVVALEGSRVNFVKSDGESRGGPMWCAVSNAGGVKCWETSTSPAWDPAVREVRDVADATSIAVAWDHACVVVKSGLPRCWHHLWVREESDDRGPRRRSIERSKEIADATDAEGQCVRRAKGPLTCLAMLDIWARAVAIGRTAYFEEYARGVTRMREGSSERCLVHEDGTLECSRGWSASVATLPPDVADVALGSSHACVLRRDGGVLCRLRLAR